MLAERWTPLVLRELWAGGHRFDDIQRGVPLMSASLLTKRLRTSSAPGSSSAAGARTGPTTSTT